jgi:DNA-binding beta-propeller fold protein YncE
MSDPSIGLRPNVTAQAPTRSKRGRRIMAVLLALIITLLLVTSFFLARLILPSGKVATQAETGGLTWVRSIYGWGPKQAQQLKSAAAVAFASNGDIIVPDVNQRPQLIDFGPDGSYKASLTSTAVIFPTAVGVGPDGRIYVVQGPRDMVTVLAPNGREVVGEIPVQQPSSVAASEDRIVIGAQGGFAILGIDGTLLKIIGSRGKGDAQFDQVAGIALDSAGAIYVVDTYNNRISKYDPTGKRVWIVRSGSPGNDEAIAGGSSISQVSTGTAGLQLPIAATLDANGRLVVVDSFDFTIAVFDTKDGSLIAKYGKFGSAEGEFVYPTGIAYDASRDWFAVADTGNSRIQIVQLPGSSSSPVAAIRAGLAGPLRACALPLVLLLLAAAYWAFRRRERAAAGSAQDGASALSSPVE